MCRLRETPSETPPAPPTEAPATRRRGRPPNLSLGGSRVGPTRRPTGHGRDARAGGTAPGDVDAAWQRPLRGRSRWN